MTTNTKTIEVYAITDDEESDPDPIFMGSHDDMLDALGNVTLELLFHDDDMGHDVYNVVRADGTVIAVAYKD
ncbi:hypothetical protein MGALJ_39520 [Mycobacterium gallinarum]|uniref:Uncharacterized protein n=1 Tax=Mycobacterium gallinarum TaxID=39689 RepID=A0A9W4FGZ5_9MYCO|nr:hypothetical protein [Mycobacterium gallinarum]BBY94283.1 hypothetical protein MGALJ_39520 [Mycobacterium gallinarum]